MKHILSSILLSLAALHAAEPINLAGRWKFAADVQDAGLTATPDQ